LRAQIASGALRPGTRLPSGRELAEQYDVALMTVQKALTMLRDEHMLVTSQGRGTFVTGEANRTPEQSPEYAEISRQLHELRDLVEQTAERLDERLSALEKSAGITPEAPQSPQQGE
jgi:GntR family transcriptional regulator